MFLGIGPITKKASINLVKEANSIFPRIFSIAMINFDDTFLKKLNGIEKNDSIGYGCEDDLGKTKNKINHNEQDCAGLSITTLDLGNHNFFSQSEEVDTCEMR